jgi:cytoplasmic iron level regulating protein YaaA (DUF328/UPF0246 family)
MPRLLLMSCSRRKRDDEASLPAIERYDGPAFRVLRRYLREYRDSRLRVVILSAEFGFLNSDDPIPNYDRGLTRERAAELRQTVRPTLKRILNSVRAREIGVCLGRDYLAIASDEIHATGVTVRVTTLNGGLGKRLTALHSWLRSGSNESE